MSLYSPIAKVTRHAFARFPWLYLMVALALVSVLAEVSAMASLFPLAELAVGRSVEPHSAWGRLAAAFPGQSPVLVFLALFLGLLLLRLVTASSVALMQARAMRRLIAHFSANAFEAFVKHLSFREIHQKTIGHFMTLAGDEANRASQIVVAVMRLVPVLLLAFLYLVALYIHARWVAFAVLAFLAAMGVGTIGAFRRSHELGARQQEESRALNTFFVDALSGLRTVRGFNAENYAAARYRDMIEHYARTCFSVDAINVLGRAVPAMVLLLAVLAATLAWLDAERLAADLAFAMAATLLVLRFLPLVGQALDTFMRITADLRAGQNVADVVDIAEESAAPLPPVEDASPIRRIEFDHVTFSYDPGKPVLRDFSAHFRAGRTYAVAGPSGSGKSTLLDLLLGFYPPASGRIRVNGSLVDARALRARVAIVEQQPRLLSDSIRNNVTFGRDASAAELSHAVSAACLDDVIAALREGVDSPVSYQGSNLSGGQRQRVSIARALLKSADVLVLDESTNGLDAQVRDRVVANVRALFREKILIFLTHDKDILGKVDEVIQVTA